MADHDGPMTSEQLAQCMGTHPVVVRRTMSGLREAGLVASRGADAIDPPSPSTVCSHHSDRWPAG